MGNLPGLDALVDPDRLRSSGDHLATPAAAGEHPDDVAVFGPHHDRAVVVFVFEGFGVLPGCLDFVIGNAEGAQLLGEVVVIVGPGQAVQPRERRLLEVLCS